jgi:hypothetical protein
MRRPEAGILSLSLILADRWQNPAIVQQLQILYTPISPLGI